MGDAVADEAEGHSGEDDGRGISVGEEEEEGPGVGKIGEDPDVR